MLEPIHRGDVVFVRLDTDTRSHVQAGERPAVVVQNDVGNRHSPTTIIILLTSSIKKMNMPTHVLVNSPCLPKKSMALCEHIYTIDKSTIDRCIGHLTPGQINTIDHALKASIFQ